MIDSVVMGSPASRIAALVLLASPLFSSGLFSQETAEYARLGILLDTSERMGFLVPQVRKEIRHLQSQSSAHEFPAIAYREMIGASLDRESSISVPARKNVLYALKALYEDEGVDTVYWITSLHGIQSGDGFFALEQLLKGKSPDSKHPRRLVLRNAWQDQLQAGRDWITNHPTQDEDPLDWRFFPSEWYRLFQEERGIVIRSWHRPPDEFRKQFGFPYRVGDSAFLRTLGMKAREATFDQHWARQLQQQHCIHFIGPKEEWVAQFTGRRWMHQASLLPFVDEPSLKSRTEKVFADLCDRESIEDDLTRIEAQKIGVLFGLGYQKSDLARLKGSRKEPTYWRTQFTADVVRAVEEVRAHQAEHEKNAVRVYATELVELDNYRKLPDGPDPYARRMAQMVRDERVDAIYFFTNGYLGGGDYGTCAIDEPLIALAIQEAGVPLYIRMPFEFGPIPTTLQQLALASGGGVFFGKAKDEDWKMPVPSPSWPANDPPE